MSQISVGQYIFARLKQLGVDSVFGVPGDYELILLDMIPAAGLDWKGNPNELNASYAADGYGRTKGVGALVMTFGPGELSGFCGIAGAYAEYVPLVSIVGYPPIPAMKNHLIMHHSLGDGKFGAFHEMSKQITVATTIITSTTNATAEIDRVLNEALYYSRPVYIGLPVDIGPLAVSSDSLSTPLITKMPPNNPTLEAEIVGKIAHAVRTLPKAVIIIDGLTIRFNQEKEVAALVRAANLPYFTTPMSKGFDETLPKFGGVYGGLGSPEGLRNGVESADCILWIGSYSSDFNTGEFTERVRPDTVVDLQRHFLTIRSKKYNLNLPDTVVALTKALEGSSTQAESQTVTWVQYPLDHPPTPERLSQDYLWPTIGRYLRPHDLVIAETGTSAYGIPYANLIPTPNVSIYSQTVFGSIGFATGAAVGSFIAFREKKTPGRPILITGEGSLQLTVQAFSDLIRHELGATIFLINNDGYTVERLIHGPTASYNHVPEWDYGKLAALFGPEAEKAGKFRHYFVQTPAELEAVLNDEEVAVTGPNSGVTQVVEMKLPMMDAPKGVLDVTRAIEEFNKIKH